MSTNEDSIVVSSFSSFWDHRKCHSRMDALYLSSTLQFVFLCCIVNLVIARRYRRSPPWIKGKARGTGHWLTYRLCRTLFIHLQPALISGTFKANDVLNNRDVKSLKFSSMESYTMHGMSLIMPLSCPPQPSFDFPHYAFFRLLIPIFSSEGTLL